MTGSNLKTIEVRVSRRIEAEPQVVFDAWLDPSVPGTTWHAAEKHILDARVDGLFFWSLRGTAHYGRFTVIDRPGRLQHTWMSPNTHGLESTVEVTFRKDGDGTMMHIVHSNLPDSDAGRGHERGWNHFAGNIAATLEQGKRR